MESGASRVQIENLVMVGVGGGDPRRGGPDPRAEQKSLFWKGEEAINLLFLEPLLGKVC